MDPTCYIEPPRTHLEPDGMEFFLQSSPANSVAAGTHLHNAVELLYIRQGSYTAYLDGTAYLLFPGDLILFCSNSIHCTLSGPEPENSYYVIKINPSVLLKLVGQEQAVRYVMRFSLNRPEYRCMWSRDVLQQHTKILSAIHNLIEEFRNSSYGSDLAMKLQTTELLLQILRSDEPTQTEKDDLSKEVTGRIFEAMTYVREHFSEDIDEKELSRNLGMSYSYFSRSFRRVTGRSFRQYLNATRVDHAEQLLLTTNQSVTEVASLCGYNHVSYFISVYRQLKGRTPKQDSGRHYHPM